MISRIVTDPAAIPNGGTPFTPEACYEHFLVYP